jgi:hypothetical protein
MSEAGFVGWDERGRFIHYCHCGAWAAYGYGMSVRHGRFGKWYCREHRPADPTKEAIMPEERPTQPLPKDDGKGPRITVPDVARQLHVKLDPGAATSIGAEVRDIYERRFGLAPKKDLFDKTNGGGSHCFAHYPANMRDQIAKIIQRHKIDEERQGSLF